MHKIKRSADAINILMYAMVISTAGLFLLDTFTDGDQKIWLLLLGNAVILTAVYAMRVFIRKMPVFIALHVLLIALCIAPAFVGDPFVSICAELFCALAAFAMLLDVLFWANAVREEKELPLGEDGKKIKNFRPVYQEGLPYIPLAFVAAFLLGMAYSLYAARPYYGRIAYVLGVVFVGFFFLRMYLERMGKTVSDIYRERGELPIRLLKSNAKLTVPVLILLFVAMFVLQSAFLVQVFDQIVLALIKAAFWLFGMFLRFLAFLGSREGATTSLHLQPVMPEAGGEGGYFAKLVEQILTVLFFGGLFALAARGVIRFVRYCSFRLINKREALVETEMTEVRERLHTREARRGNRRMRSAKTPDEKVRRLYRKFLLRQQKNGLEVRSYETPLERIDALTNVTGKDREEIGRLTELYDLARYAPMRIRDEDVKTMERLV